MDRVGEFTATTNVEITDKGVEEVASRKFKLSIKKRSILIQLSKPKTVEALLQNTVFPTTEIAEALQSLADEGFIALSGDLTTASPEQSSKPDYEIVQTSAFRFVVKDAAPPPAPAETKNTTESDNKEPTIVRVNSFRFVVK